MSIEWNGEGLPPVGTVCSAYYSGMNQGVVRVEYIGKNACVLYSLERHEEQCSMTDRYSFFPIPDQGLLEARKRAIKEIGFATGLRARDGQIEVATRLYEAGYRKVEGGAA